MTDIRTGSVRVALAVTAILALLMTACGGGSSPTASTAVPDSSAPPTGSPSSSPSAEVGPTMFPPTGQVLTGGTYRSVMTDPSVTMTLPGTWLVFGQTSNFVIAQIGTTATMKEFYVFKFDGRIVDPKDNETIVQTDDLIDSLRTNAHVRFLTQPRPVTVGGARGEVFDLEAVHAPACAYYNDGTSCWSLFPIVEGSPYSPTAVGEGGMLVIGPGSDPAIQAPVRFWVVKVHGQQMIIGWQDDAPTFDASVKDFEQILQTVRWS